MLAKHGTLEKLTQQESSAAVMEFKKKQVSADLEAQKDSARRKARQ